MLKASDIMTRDVLKISGLTRVAKAIELMRARGCRSLIVDRRNPYDAYGIMTETDIIHKVVAPGKDPHTVRVSEIMTKPCIVVNPDLQVEEVARLFTQHRLRVAPVIQGDLVGIISASDILAKSDGIDPLQQQPLEEELAEATKKTRIICAKQGLHSEPCAEAWEAVEMLQSEAAHQRVDNVLKTALEEYCEEFPEDPRSSFYENLCSG